MNEFDQLCEQFNITRVENADSIFATAAAPADGIVTLATDQRIATDHRLATNGQSIATNGQVPMPGTVLFPQGQNQHACSVAQPAIRIELQNVLMQYQNALIGNERAANLMVPLHDQNIPESRRRYYSILIHANRLILNNALREAALPPVSLEDGDVMSI